MLVVVGAFQLFQNCGQYRLKPGSKELLSGQASGEGVTYLKPPAKIEGAYRAVIFFDQSYSMLYGRCPNDLDGPTPAETGRGCASPLPGIDPMGDRFRVIYKWLDQLGPDDRVALMPFSGGIKERPRFMKNGDLYDRFDHYKFLTVEEAKQRLARYICEQDADLGIGSDPTTGGQNTRDNCDKGLVLPIDPGFITSDEPMGFGNIGGGGTSPKGRSPKYFGTTVPLSTLNTASQIVAAEMMRLKDQGILYSSVFDFVYLSDGMLRPLMPHIDAGLQLAGCSSPQVTGCDKTYNLLLANYGHPDDNKLENIYLKLATIKDGYSRYIGEGQVRMSLVKVHPERVQDEANASESTALFDNLERLLDVNVFSIKDGNPPFNLGTTAVGNMSYSLRSFYVVNLNGRVNEFGNAVVDSDGDGVPDDVELADGTDPSNPRTNGVCLDGLAKSIGCRTDMCDAAVDQDNDGLNECEEGMLATSPFKIDTDGDGIPDALEAISNFHPIVSDQGLDSNSDGTPDEGHFKAGVSHQVKLSSVPSVYKVDFDLTLKDYRSTDPNVSLKSGGYQVSINNVPLFETGESNSLTRFYIDKSKEHEIVDEKYMLGSSHAAKENQILMIGEVVANEDPRVRYWIMSKVKVKSIGKDQKQKIEVDFSKFQELFRRGG